MLRGAKLRMCGKSEMAGGRIRQELKSKLVIRIGMAASSLLVVDKSLGPQLWVQRGVRAWP